MCPLAHSRLTTFLCEQRPCTLSARGRGAWMDGRAAWRAVPGHQALWHDDIERPGVGADGAGDECVNVGQRGQRVRNARLRRR